MASGCWASQIDGLAPPAGWRAPPSRGVYHVPFASSPLSDRAELWPLFDRADVRGENQELSSLDPPRAELCRGV